MKSYAPWAGTRRAQVLAAVRRPWWAVRAASRARAMWARARGRTATGRPLAR
ncbi:hypothetical protein GCM10009678_30460 [Actinomadura kijaniata]|uniref:Uncharacterized protein (DUF2236 family) n=1 Tax=Actinomadura namibiensis TaxID=182080 RepID=A0A7W3QMG7_ACTNM|nr:hypothetical protein [Actinomadura namibiensis]MBA8951988.1 uncharacterized protein (DUF2236 family) [Actinomadura namibiensis]